MASEEVESLNLSQVELEELTDEVLMSWLVCRGHGTPPVYRAGSKRYRYLALRLAVGLVAWSALSGGRWRFRFCHSLVHCC